MTQKKSEDTLPAKFAEAQDYDTWLESNDYFNDLAVFSIGTLHPGGLEASKFIIDSYIWPNKKVLDIGMGNGFTMKFLTQLGAECHGVEKSAFMVKSAFMNGLDKNNIFHSDIEQFAFNSTYDLIIFEGVLGFVENPSRVLKKCLANLNPEGQLIINDWIPFAKSSYENLPEYFKVYGKTDPNNIADLLNLKNGDYSFSVHQTHARSPKISINSASDRVEKFFNTKVSQVDKKKIIEKTLKMKSVLGEETQAKFYIMKINAANIGGGCTTTN